MIAPLEQSETPVQTLVPMMPGKNGGMLRRGNPGKPGQGGRPPDEAKELATLGFTRAVKEVLSRISQAENLDDAALARYADMLGKFGPGVNSKVTLEHEDVPRAFARVMARNGFEPDVIASLGDQLKQELGIK